MIRRSVKLSILNPQYAFLDLDFHNPNLTQAELIIEHISEEVLKDSKLAENTKTALKIIPSNIYIKLNLIMGWLILIPIDMYFVAALLIGKFLS